MTVRTITFTVDLEVDEDAARALDADRLAVGEEAWWDETVDVLRTAITTIIGDNLPDDLPSSVAVHVGPRGIDYYRRPEPCPGAE